MKIINVGSDFSGVGAFDQALMRLGIEYKTVFACDMDKFARQSYIANYGEPKYYPKDVYNREVPNDPLDIYMSSPPCQTFSLAGSREGEQDERGILFYNSHEFIVKNKPRYFIFENVKGLLSDDRGRTFQRWLDHLGGKSMNGNPVIFPYEKSVPYHIYWKVLNAKDFNIPQNRERVFIVGIRDDSDNTFRWPITQPLEKRLKDVLEEDVEEKYYLSDRMLNGFLTKKTEGFGERFKPTNGEKYSMAVTTGAGTRITDNFIKVNSATSKGYEIATEEDSINFTHPNSKTRRGRVGKGVAQTLDTACDQGVVIGAIRRRNQNNKLSTHQMMELNNRGISNALTTVQKDNLVVYNDVNPYLNSKKKRLKDYRIRRLTPRECFRLMDFPEDFQFVVSNSQLYKQAGNSIVVKVLEEIISKLKL